MARSSSAEPARSTTASRPREHSLSSPTSLPTETQASHWKDCKRKRHHYDADEEHPHRHRGRDEYEQCCGSADVEEDELQSDNELSVHDVSTSSITSANSFSSPMTYRGQKTGRSAGSEEPSAAFDRSTLSSATSIEDERSPGSAKQAQDGRHDMYQHRGRDERDDDRSSYQTQGTRTAGAHGGAEKADASSDAAESGHRSFHTSSPMSANERASRPRYAVTMLAGAPQRKSCDRCFRMKTKCSRAAPGASNDKPCEGCIRRGFGHDCITSRPDFPQPRITLAKRPRRDIHEECVALPAQSEMLHTTRSMDMHPRHSSSAADAGCHPHDHIRREEHRRGPTMASSDSASHASSLQQQQHPDQLAGRRGPPSHESRYAASDAARHFRPTFAPIQHQAPRRPDRTVYDSAAHGSVSVTSRYDGAGFAWSGEHKSKPSAGGSPPSLLAAMRASHHAESVCQAIQGPTARGGYGHPPPPINRLRSMRIDELHDALIVIAEELAKRATASTMPSATGLGVRDAPPASASSTSSTSPSAFPSPHTRRGQVIS